MLIDRLATQDGNQIYYDPTFRTILEDHLTFIRNSNEITTINIEPAMAYKYEGDLFGLLFNYGITFEQHWIIMRLNGFTNPNQNKSTLLSLITPSRAIVERIRAVYMTRNRVVN